MKNRVIRFIKKHPLLIMFNILGLYLFAKMAEDVMDKEFIIAVDQWISIHINVVRTPLLNEVMIFITNLNGGMGILLFSLVVMVVLAYLKWYKDLLFYTMSIGGAAFVFTMVKVIVQRIRPSSELMDVTGYAFPSGHATMATAMAVALYFILVKRIYSRELRILLFFSSIAWPLIIAASRVYLEVHWLSDVIAGLGLGLFWVTFIVLVMEGKKDNRP